METGNIIIKGEGVNIHPVNGEVWLSVHQMADLFEVTVSAINSNVRSINKSGALKNDFVMKTFDNGNGSLVEKYNLELIIALSFRLQSAKSDSFRAYIIKTIIVTDKIASLPISNIHLN